MDQAGRVLGEHQGLASYTIGQRKGLGVAAREPLHVLRLDAARNTLVVGPAAALERDKFTLHQTTYPSGEELRAPFDAAIKVRYKAAPVPGVVTPLPDGRAAVMLSLPQRAITAGQAAVFYGGADGDEVIGGGLIED
jgi:tRNA-specific 2-thiouridylase